MLGCTRANVLGAFMFLEGFGNVTTYAETKMSSSSGPGSQLVKLDTSPSLSLPVIQRNASLWNSTLDGMMMHRMFHHTERDVSSGVSHCCVVTLMKWPGRARTIQRSAHDENKRTPQLDHNTHTYTRACAHTHTHTYGHARSRRRATSNNVPVQVTSLSGFRDLPEIL